MIYLNFVLYRLYQKTEHSTHMILILPYFRNLCVSSKRIAIHCYQNIERTSNERSHVFEIHVRHELNGINCSFAM